MLYYISINLNKEEGMFLSREKKEKISKKMKKLYPEAKTIMILWRTLLAWHCWRPMVRVKAYTAGNEYLNSGCSKHRSFKKFGHTEREKYFCTCSSCDAFEDVPDISPGSNDG
jgi:hypothetical protein